MTQRLSDNLGRVQRACFAVAGLGALALAAGFFVDRQRFFQSYLLGYLYILGPALGSLALFMLHNMTGGGWGFAIKRLLEAAMRTLPAMAVLFVPVALGVHSLYEWSHADVVAQDEILKHKAPYLNVPFFYGRAALYFLVWIGLGLYLLKQVDKYDKKLSLKALRKLKGLSGLGIVLYVLTMTFASFDWAMSLEPHWFSTIYGVHFIVGQGLTTLCLMILVASRLVRHEPFDRWISPGHFHDLGNLTMAFVMLWAYVAFSQFLIIWSGNLPEEVPWYLTRLGTGWQVLAVALLLCHFVTPFAILLMRSTKRNPPALARVAAALLVVRLLDYYWQLAPAFEHGHFHPHWLDLAAPVTLGALWLGLFLKNLRGRPLVSLQDAKLLGQLEAPAH